MIAPATSMLSAKLKIAQSKPIGIDVEVDEVADVAEDQAIVAVAHGAGHDQAQGDGQDPARGRAQDEEVVADHDRGHDREAREDHGCCREASTRIPRGRRCSDWCAARGSRG